jgi:hypothetical protein
LCITVWTGDTRDTRPTAVMGRIEIPQRSSPLPYRGVLFLSIESTGGTRQ